MFNKLLNFIKYNNAAVIVAIIIFIIGTGALASETGRAAVGQKQTTIEGVDNALLLAADLDNLDLEYKIEKIEADSRLYYITYTYIDLIKKENVWQYQLQEKVRKVSRRLDEDLGEYLAEELSEEYQAKINDLKKAQVEAREAGQENRVEITEYSGLIGKALNAASKVFPNYNPVKKTVLPSPVSVESLKNLAGSGKSEPLRVDSSGPDDLAQVYLDYVAENDPDKDELLGISDNCPTVYNPNQIDSDGDGLGDVCDIDNIEKANESSEEDLSGIEGEESVEIFDLSELEGPADSSFNSEANAEGSASNEEEVIGSEESSADDAGDQAESENDNSEIESSENLPASSPDDGLAEE